MPETFFPQAQLVCLLPVGTFNYVTFTWNVCFSAMPVNQLNLVLIYMKLSAWPLKQDLYYHSFYYFIQFWNKFVQFELTNWTDILQRCPLGLSAQGKWMYMYMHVIRLNIYTSLQQLSLCVQYKRFKAVRLYFHCPPPQTLSSLDCQSACR